ncbi:MAG: Fic family protein [Bdellovibrionales bacterium]|nr:Fic family protein [Bdellovibrionales bacterium]
MDRSELHSDLAREYEESVSSGVEGVDHPVFKDVWFVIPPPTPRVSPSSVSPKVVADAAEAIAEQPGLDQATELDHLVSYLFLRKEAVESSRIEGTMSTIDHVLSPGELFDSYKARSEGASVRGYAHALQEEFKRIATEGLSIFSIALISRLHSEMMRLDPRFKGIPGRIRSEPLEVAWIRGRTQRPQDSIYNPVPPRHVRRCLEGLMAWYGDQNFVEIGDAGMGMPLVVRMAIGHAQFEAIHPFSDGNGRVGRMLLTLQMACHGKIPIYLSGYIEEHRDDYYRALQEAQKKLNYSPIVELFAYALIASSIEGQRTRDCINELPGEWMKRGEFRKGSAAEKALSWLRVNPIFTVKQIAAGVGVSPQAANAAVDQLRKRKVVRERTGYERNRVFAAEEVISLLSRRFGSSAHEALEGARHLMEKSGGVSD